jgi:hypothetical protein
VNRRFEGTSNMNAKARVIVMAGGTAVLTAIALAFTYLNHKGFFNDRIGDDEPQAYVNFYTAAISIILMVLFCGFWLIASRGLSFKTKLFGAALCALLGTVFFKIFMLYNAWV